MEIVVQPDGAAVCRLAADLVAALVAARPSAVLGLATGHTMVGVYEELVRRHGGGLSFRAVRSFNLDEYLGVPPEHPGSFHSFMAMHLLRHVDLPPAQARILDGLTADVPAECEAFEREIAAAGGIDLQVLGIGGDGHIGFNEPSSSLASRTRIKTLTAQTRTANAAAFGGEGQVPRHVLTMGVGTILDARRCVLLAIGERKAAAVAAAAEGAVTAMVPASALQLHPAVTLIADEAAASRLARRAYYDEVYAGKPEWQR